jgi:hypothetical protein
LPTNAERVATGQGNNPLAISTVLAKPTEIATTPQEIQQRRIARLFFLQPETAATIARLHFGEVRV